MHVHINMCKYQWEEFGGQPQGSQSAHVFPAKTMQETTYTQTTVFPSNFNNLIKSTCDPNIQKETIFPQSQLSELIWECDKLQLW